MFNFKDVNINIEKSIHSDRVVYKNKWFHFFLDKALFLIVFLIILVTFFMVMSIKEPAVPTDNTWKYFLPMLFVTGFLTIIGFKTDKLIRVRGLNQEANRKLVIETIEELNWNLNLNNNNIVIVTPSTEYLVNGGRQVTIIYDQKDILLNSTAYGFLGGVSPMHFISNGSIIRQIRKKLSKK